MEHVQALDVLVAFDAAGGGRRRIEAIGSRLARATRARAAASGAASAATTAVGGIAVAASLAAATPLLEGGRIDGPTFAVLCLVPLAIAEVASAIPLAVSALRLARSSAERVAHAVPAEVPAGIPHAADRPREPARSGDPPPAIALRGIRAHWPAASDESSPDPRPAALVHVDLDLAPGERVLVRGPSGAGKTTLAHVLVRFLDYEGSYRLGGVEASALEPSAVRRLVGLVEQRPVAVRRGRAPEPPLRARHRDRRRTPRRARARRPARLGRGARRSRREGGRAGRARVGRTGAAHRARPGDARRLPGARARRADRERRCGARRRRCCATSRMLRGDRVRPSCSSRTPPSTSPSSTAWSRSTRAESLPARPCGRARHRQGHGGRPGRLGVQGQPSDRAAPSVISGVLG